MGNDSEILVIDRQKVIAIFLLELVPKKQGYRCNLQKCNALPRMARMWSHLDRQGGGSGGGKGGGGAARGEGEKQIGVDGALLEKIDRVKAELEKVRQQRKTQRKRGTAPTCLMQQSWAT